MLSDANFHLNIHFFCVIRWILLWRSILFYIYVQNVKHDSESTAKKFFKTLKVIRTCKLLFNGPVDHIFRNLHVTRYTRCFVHPILSFKVSWIFFFHLWNANCTIPNKWFNSPIYTTSSPNSCKRLMILAPDDKKIAISVDKLHMKKKLKQILSILSKTR